MTRKSDSTTVYLGNTRTISTEYLTEYCSKFGLILDCSRRLKSIDQTDLVDFTFVRFLNRQSSLKFLSTSSHVLNNGITLDVRPFDEILHPAVPLHVDRKICIRYLPSHISMNDIKKYLRTFGTIKQADSYTNDQEQKNVYIEFEAAATRNKLLKGKIRVHRIRDHTLTILPLLRPTDVDLYHSEESKNSTEETNRMIDLETEYHLKIREKFALIENEISQFLQEKRQHYERIRKLIE